MDNACVDDQEDVLGRKASLHKVSKDGKFSVEDDLDFPKSQPKRLVKRVNSGRAIVLNVNQAQINNAFKKDMFIHSVFGLESRIPKLMVSVDEKYLRHCLELIQISTLKASQCMLPVSLSLKNMGDLYNNSEATKFVYGDTFNSSEFAFESPIAAGIESAVLSPVSEWSVGSIMGSKSMRNILKSPLLQQFGASDGDANLRSMRLSDPEKSFHYDFTDSPSCVTDSPSHRLEKTASHTHGSDSAHKRIFSVSGSNSTLSGQSSVSVSLSRGMLQCTWKEGIPYFVFSIDNHKGVYIGKLKKVDPTGDKALDYIYLFHLSKGGLKNSEIPTNESNLIGKMNVSTRFTLCSNNSKVMETEFVLFGSNEVNDNAMCSSSNNNKRTMGLPKKVVDVLRTSQSSKFRTLSIGGSSSIMERRLWDPSLVSRKNIDVSSRPNLLEAHPPSNFELAAIVARSRLHVNCQEELGGWGLKFLQKSGTKQTKDGLEKPLPSDLRRCGSGDCTTSMSILIPDGFHGGPTDKDGGPSGLIERWRSNGHCDCGGWDIGCPFTVLMNKSSNEDALAEADIQGECKSYDIYTQGSKNLAPTLRMVNVHDGLYFIHFQPQVSVLQSFSIAVAMVHTQSPTLRPDVCTGMEVAEWN